MHQGNAWISDTAITTPAVGDTGRVIFTLVLKHMFYMSFRAWSKSATVFVGFFNDSRLWATKSVLF